MHRFLRLFLDGRVLGVLGLALLAAFLFLGADLLRIGRGTVALALAAVAALGAAAWGVGRLRARRAAARLERGLGDDFRRAGRAEAGRTRDRNAAIQERLQEAIRILRESRLGERSGRAALYELPWYMVIGNPAAGKSTAIVQSGLRFPFARGADNILQGIGGTRNCDWFFTSEGILIDTAGRYAVEEEDRAEWLGFLALLKKHRPKAPINGILIAASIAELGAARPDAVIRLAKSLRQRMQELTEALEVFAPVYVLFTKADLIAGFADFFAGHDAQERDRVWGATLPYAPAQGADAVAQFDRHFDELQDGLQELALANMALRRGRPMPPAVLAFPLEFAGMKPVLRTFVATLFEENPYQHRPVFRGFYFTSAVQAGEPGSRIRHGVAEQFALEPPAARPAEAAPGAHGFFLKELFTRVVFADRDLVRQHASPARARARAAGFAAGVVALALLLAGWSWSYLGNRQLVAGVEADLDKAVRLQRDRVDLASRMEALALLQDRLEEMVAWRRQRPFAMGLGLYQGEAVELKLRQEYFQGVRRVMLEPVAQALEGYLGEVNQRAAELRPAAAPAGAAAPLPAAAPAQKPAAAAGGSRYAEASPVDVEDAYKALKTYLMLAERARMDPGHLTDQVTRFWRGWLEANRGTMPRDQLMRSAERTISFSMAHLQDPVFPVLASNFGLVDQTRENLRRVVQGTPALDRVYAEIKARASTRYAPVTVAGIVGDKGRAAVAGSHLVPGTFTREAWSGYIEPAFRDAAQNALQSTDWVLRTSVRDDLSLQGSPEQIRKALAERYQAEYAREWQRFVQGVAIAEFGGFDAAVERMNLLGDSAESPLRKLFAALHAQTAWDVPARAAGGMEGARRGVVEWFRQTVLRVAPVDIPLALPADGAAAAPAGPLGREFAPLARIVAAREGGGGSLLDGYLQSLARVRSRFNQVKNQGDAGPAARALMAATFEGAGSELAEALKFVDEQMLAGAGDGARAALKPLLVRPLIQSFAVLVPQAEAEVNRLWSAQVLQPFQQNLAGKYPFDPVSRVEAAPAEIARVFGPSGAVARFATEALGPLVVRRGDTVAPRLWAQMGLRLRPALVEGLAGWVAVQDGAAGLAAPAGAPAAAPAQSAFQLLPEGAAGFVQYSVEIDGQRLEHRNGAAAWQDFVWPNAGAAPGARVSGVTADGRTVEVFAAPGSYGFERLIDAAEVKKLPGGIRILTWGSGAQAVTVQYRAVTSPGPAAPAAGGAARTAGPGLRGLRLPDMVAGAEASSPPPAPSAPGVPGIVPVAAASSVAAGPPAASVSGGGR